MDKNGVATFSGWNKGQAKHPIYGFGLLQNVEVFENKGLAQIKNLLYTMSAPVGAYLPVAKVDDFILFGGNTNGSLFNGSTHITDAIDRAWDMVKYKDYIWVRYGSKLAAYGPLSTAPAWFTAILTSFNADFYGKIIQGQDGYLYTTSGNEVVKLDVTSYGIPGVAPTVSIATTLDLPDGQFATTIEEHGTKIIVGTQGDEGYFNTGIQAKAKLFAWNRQAGTLGNPGLADLPVSFKEDRINAILSHQNKLYVSAGVTGNIYVTDATNYQKVATLPYTQNVTVNTSRVTPNSMTISAKGTLIVGLSSLPIGSEGDARYGIYEIDIDSPGYPVSFRTLASGTTDNSAGFYIGFIREDFNSMYVGWTVNNVNKIDATLAFVTSAYPATIETDLRKVGTFNNKKTFGHMEWSLAEPLQEGGKIEIYYRTSATGTYVLINSYGYSSTATKEVGGVVSYEDIFPSVELEYVQLKAVLTNEGGGFNNISLVSISVW